MRDQPPRHPGRPSRARLAAREQAEDYLNYLAATERLLRQTAAYPVRTPQAVACQRAYLHAGRAFLAAQRRWQARVVEPAAGYPPGLEVAA